MNSPSGRLGSKNGDGNLQNLGADHRGPFHPACVTWLGKVMRMGCSVCVSTLWNCTTNGETHWLGNGQSNSLRAGKSRI